VGVADIPVGGLANDCERLLKKYIKMIKFETFKVFKAPLAKFTKFSAFSRRLNIHKHLKQTINTKKNEL
jgi:hypothetical protein